MTKFSVIIPAHNEEDNIERVIRQLQDKVGFEFELVIVNDHSSDQTAGIVNRLSREFANLKLVNNQTPAGFANALKSGFSHAQGEFVLPVMADLCDESETINQMFELADQGFDIVCGSRYMPGGRKIGGPRLKSFFSRFVGASLNLLVGIPTRDISNSFKLYRKKILERMEIGSKGFEISVEIPLKAYFLGYKITEIPTTWKDRKEGESKFRVLKQGPAYLKLYLWAMARKLCTRLSIIL